MIDIALIRDPEKRQAVARALAKRGIAAADIEKLAALDEAWRTLRSRLDDIRAQKNKVSAEIASANKSDRQKLITTAKRELVQKKDLEQELVKISQDRDDAWRTLPNIPLDDVPVGGENDFVVIAESEIKPSQEPGKHYLEIAGQYIDLERAAKVSGSRFVYLTGKLARLEFGLISYILDKLTQAGFMPVVPPVMVTEEAMAGMGYLDHEGDEIYRTQDDLYLVGTSEQALGPMHMNEILPESSLPLRYVAFSTCFRREAGSHGKDVRGMLRVHQFDKVEMFSLAHPEKSPREHEFILAQQRAIFDDLELPYRVISSAAGDLAASAAKRYDIETWLPGENNYRETNSTSNTTDFQARRLNIRFRDEQGKNHLVHMLNGTAVAIGRTLIAVIENHQRSDGTIAIPKALHSYLPFTQI